MLSFGVNLGSLSIGGLFRQPTADCGSPMTGDCHVGFCERREARFLPATHLKQRNDSKVTKKYDEAQTPFQRATARKDITKTCRSAMDETMLGIRPGELYRQIQDLTSRLEPLSLQKAPAPVKPRVNRAFNA